MGEMNVPRVVFASAIGATGLAVCSSIGAVLHVDAASPGGGNGTGWRTAFNTLPPALSAAQPGDEIRVANGTYKPTATTDRAMSFVVPSGAALLGGYAGFGAPDPDARDIALFPTILSGNIGVAGTPDNSWHVLTTSGVSRGTLIEGFTIRDGNAGGGGDATTLRGGGVLNIGGSPTLRLCTVRENLSRHGGAGVLSSGGLVLDQCVVSMNADDSIDDGSGGGILQEGGTLFITGCTLSMNAGDSRGGGIAAIDAAVTVADTLFDDNDAFSGGGLHLDTCITTLQGVTIRNSVGGGLAMSDGALTASACTFASNYHDEDGAGASLDGDGPIELVDCEFLGNLSDESGGAVHVFSPTTFIGCRFEGNTAANSPFDGAGGGAVHVATHGPPQSFAGRFVACDFIDNTAKIDSGVNPDDSYGGAISTVGKIAVTNCRFLGNSARRGGGLYVEESARAIVVNTEFSGNFAPLRAGAVLNDAGRLALRNCTVAGNSSTTQGGGIVVSGSGGNPETTIANCILWGNTTAGAATLTAQLLDLGTGTPSVDYTIVQGLSPGQALGGEANNGLDPMFAAPLGTDGVAGTIDDDLSLLFASPAIDSGANNLVGLDLADVDLDGVVAEFVDVDLAGSARFADAEAADTGCGANAIVDRGAREARGVVFVPPVGDLDGDGVVAARDLGLLLASWGACPEACCPADLDADGLVNQLDLAILMEASWNMP